MDLESIKTILNKYGLQTGYNEGLEIFNLVEKIIPKTILEIGVSEGGSLELWSKLLGVDGLLIGLDAHDILKWDITKTICKTVFVHGESQLRETVSEVTGVLGNRPIDFLRIDGCHEYIGVSNDFNNYAPLVRKGGVIVFHDNASSIDVGRFVKEISSKYNIKLIDESSGFPNTVYFIKENEYGAI